MKNIVFLFILVANLFASTQYKTPAFEVVGSPLYCSDKGELTTVKVGDVLDGDYVINHCSKNLSTAQNDVKAFKNKVAAQQAIDEKIYNQRYMYAIPIIAISMAVFVFFIGEIFKSNYEYLDKCKKAFFAGLVASLALGLMLNSAEAGLALLFAVVISIVISNEIGVYLFGGGFIAFSIYLVIVNGAIMIVPAIGIIGVVYVLGKALLEYRNNLN